MSEPSETRPGRFTHLVHFYENGAFLLDEVERFIGEGLESGEAVVVVAAEPHRDGLEGRLIERGFDLAAAREDGRYVSLDATETLSKFMERGWPKTSLFMEAVGGAIARASERGRSARVRVFGEMAALLWAEGNREAAFRLERIWNDLAEIHPLSLYCAYPMTGFRREARGRPFLDICAEHTRVVPDPG